MTFHVFCQNELQFGQLISGNSNLGTNNNGIYFQFPVLAVSMATLKIRPQILFHCETRPVGLSFGLFRETGFLRHSYLVGTCVFA